MKIRNPFVIRCLGFVAGILIRLWIGTLNYRLHFPAGIDHPTNPRHSRYIYAIWHESILFATTFRALIHVLISQHADGELIAQVCRYLRFKVVRGSSTRGGAQALLALMDVSQYSHLLVTPDGPRGPRRKVQIGLIFLASKTGLPIIPCGIGYEKEWRANSWDRFAVPKPFSKVYGIGSHAIHIPPSLNRRQLDYYLDLVEKQMLELTEIAEEWAKTGQRSALSKIKIPPT